MLRPNFIAVPFCLCLRLSVIGPSGKKIEQGWSTGKSMSSWAGLGRISLDELFSCDVLLTALTEARLASFISLSNMLDQWYITVSRRKSC